MLKTAVNQSDADVSGPAEREEKSAVQKAFKKI